MAFSRPTTTTVAPKTALCSGIVTNDSGLVTTAEHGYTHSTATHALTDIVKDPTGSRNRSETLMRVTGDQRITPYSGTHTSLCPKHLIGEACRKCRCSHLCTGQLGEIVPPTPVQQTSGEANQSPHMTPPGPGPSDNDSDPDSTYALHVDSPWHQMDGHSGSHLASLLNSLEFPTYSMGDAQPEVDHGYLHASVQPHETDLDLLQEPAAPWSVEESSTQRPGQQELVLAKPLKSVLTPNQSRESFHDERHVYARPFICNMPELQPNFVGEMRSE